jgi:CheY-like chemotaxis protein
MIASLHVLVVEPEPATRDLVSDLLAEAGLEVTTAYDREDARRVLSVFPVDVVVGAMESATAPVVAIPRPLHGLILLEAIRHAARTTSH